MGKQATILGLAALLGAAPLQSQQITAVHAYSVPTERSYCVDALGADSLAVETRHRAVVRDDWVCNTELSSHDETPVFYHENGKRYGVRVPLRVTAYFGDKKIQETFFATRELLSARQLEPHFIFESAIATGNRAHTRTGLSYMQLHPRFFLEGSLYVSQQLAAPRTSELHGHFTAVVKALSVEENMLGLTVRLRDEHNAYDSENLRTFQAGLGGTASGALVTATCGKAKYATHVAARCEIGVEGYVPFNADSGRLDGGIRMYSEVDNHDKERRTMSLRLGRRFTRTLRLHAAFEWHFRELPETTQRANPRTGRNENIQKNRDWVSIAAGLSIIR